MSKLQQYEEIKNILNNYYKKEKRKYIYTPTPYIQIKSDKSISKLNLNNIIKNNGIQDEESINAITNGMRFNKSNFNDYEIYTLVGANLKNSNIPFEKINNLFLSPDGYQKTNLDFIINNIDNIPDTDLSNNNYSNKSWNIHSFIKPMIEIIKQNINTQDKEIIIKIITKIIPILYNTKIKIYYESNEKPSYLEEIIIKTAISEGKFDGCYIEESILTKKYNSNNTFNNLYNRPSPYKRKVRKI